MTKAKAPKPNEETWDENNGRFLKNLSPFDTKQVLETMSLLGIKSRATAVGMGLKLFVTTYGKK